MADIFKIGHKSKHRISIALLIPANLFIKNERIEMVRQHRILGVIFDERANWRAHIFDAKARALKKLNIIKSLSHTPIWAQTRKRSCKYTR
jgi:hypothetical protein